MCPPPWKSLVKGKRFIQTRVTTMDANILEKIAFLNIKSNIRLCTTTLPISASGELFGPVFKHNYIN